MMATQLPIVRVPLGRPLQVVPVGQQRRFRPVLFWILMVYFVLEYARPPYIVNLRLQGASLVLLLTMWAFLPARPWSRNLTLQLSFLVLCAISVLFAKNYFSAYIATRIVLGNLIIAIAITWLMATRRNFVTGIWIWIAIVSYQAIYAIGHQGVGTGGFLGDDNDLALGCATAFPFALTGFLRFRGWRRWGSGAVATLLTVAIVVSNSRGGFVGWVGAALFCVLANRNRVRNLAIAALCGAVFYLSVPSSYKEEMSTIDETTSGTAEGRLFLWVAAWEMWLDHPLLGVGAANFKWHAGQYQPSGESEGLFSSGQYRERDWTGTQTHSLYFEALSETGILGCLALGAIIAGHFSGLRRLSRRVGMHQGLSPELRNDAGAYAVALSGAMVGYLAAGAFLSVTYYPYPWYLSAMAVAWERVVDMELAGSKLPEAVVVVS